MVDPLTLRDSLVGALGMELHPPKTPPALASTGFQLTASMPVDSRTCQPYGFLSGGASVALAETLAGFGSFLVLPPHLKPVGAAVSANHVGSVAKGGRVEATATLVHMGRRTHVWNVDIHDVATGRLISTARIQNQIVTLG